MDARESELLQPPPLAHESEAAILGELILDIENQAAIIGSLRSETFHHAYYKEIVTAAIALYSRTGALDTTLLVAELKGRGLVENPMAEIAKLARGGFLPGNWREHLARVTAAHSQHERHFALLRNVEQNKLGQPLAELPPDSSPRKARPLLGWEPFPVDALPGTVRDYVAAGAESIGCDPAFIALPMLAALGGLCGGAVRLRLKDSWHVSPSIWAVVVAESGSQKSPGWKLATAPLSAIERRLAIENQQAERAHEEQQMLYARNLRAFHAGKLSSPGEQPSEPAPRRLVVADCTIEALAPILAANPRGLLLSRDELNGWLCGFDKYSNSRGGADASAWLSIYSNADFTVDRKSGKPRTLYVQNPVVSICGTIQPRTLTQALGSEHRENGLLARFLVAAPPSSPRVWRDADLPASLSGPMQALAERLHSFNPHNSGEEFRPATLELDGAARRRWIQFYNEHGQAMDGLSGDLRAAYSKLEETAARIALLLHLTVWADEGGGTIGLLDSGVVGGAVEIVKWARRETARVYGLLHETDSERETRQIVEIVQRHGGELSARDLMRASPQQFPKATDAERMLSRLAREGLGDWATRQGETGRPARVFRMALDNPAHDTTPPDTPLEIDTTPNNAGNNELCHSVIKENNFGASRLGAA
ncbi:MAG: DUF3987 domain-containing protein [Pirellulales bacterium]|nr:DUF3987 domain-containing protein [Pirellulales bacterium]